MIADRIEYLFFLMEDEAQIRGCFEDGFEGACASCSMEDGQIRLELKGGGRVTAVSAGGVDAKRFRDEMNEVWNKFCAAETAHLDVKTNLLHQIRLYRALYEVGMTGIEDGEKDINSALLDTCCNGGGLLLDGERSVFRDEDGRVVLDADGRSELDFYDVRALPVLPPDGVPPAVLKRQTRTLALLRARHIYSPGWLPPQKDRPSERFPDCENTTRRLIALTLSALYSDGITGQHWPPKESHRYLEPYLNAYGAAPFFSPKERAYLALEQPEQDIVIEYSWNYEHAWVLFWALGFTDTLAFPDCVCDTAALADTLKACPTFEALAARGTLRDRDELLDAADLYFRYNWAVLDVCGQMGGSAPAQMNPGVVYSRHKALSWLTGGGAWDDVGMEC